MTNEQCRALMASIIFTDLDKDSIPDNECVFDVAVSLAEDLFEHAMVDVTHDAVEEPVSGNPDIKH